jgi:hypothetical protein
MPIALATIERAVLHRHGNHVQAKEAAWGLPGDAARPPGCHRRRIPAAKDVAKGTVESVQRLLRAIDRDGPALERQYERMSGRP